MSLPEWEILADALKRIRATGLETEYAKSQICSKIADGDVGYRVKVDVTDPDIPGEILYRPQIKAPPDLGPEDLDWNLSKPYGPWETGPGQVDSSLNTLEYPPRRIARLDLWTDHVVDIFCPAIRDENAMPAAGSTSGVDAKVSTANEVPRIINPTAQSHEPRVPHSFPAEPLPAGGPAPPGYLTLPGTLEVIISSEYPDLLVPLGVEGADAMFALAKIGVAALAKQLSADNAARRRALYDHRRSVAHRHRVALEQELAKIWYAAEERLWHAFVCGMLPLTAETPEGTLVKLSVLALKEHSLRTVFDRDQVAWFDRQAPGQDGVGGPLVAEADVQRWMDDGAPVGCRAESALGIVVEPLRASTGWPAEQKLGGTSNWTPLMDALDWADSTLGADAWGLMMEWNQSEELPMRGRADGITQVFQCHWFDCSAWWGPGADADGEIPSGDRPKRSQLDPRMTKKLAPRPSRSTAGDVLYFDQVTATSKGVNVPRLVSNVLVDMTALRRLCTDWRQPGAADMVAAHLPEMVLELRKAADAKIHETISAIYDYAAAQGMKPPDLHDIAKHVLPRLNREGLTATGVRIQTLAGDKFHEGRRRAIGARIYGSLLPFSDPEI
jgi:hypothetical protein